MNPNTSFKLLLLFALVLGCDKPQNTTTGEKNEPTQQAALKSPVQAPSHDPSSPESILRAFLIGIVEKDHETLIRTGNGEGPLELLLDGETLTGSQLAETISHFETMEITRLRVGDSITFPNGKKIAFGEHDINSHRLKLMVPSNPIAFDLQKFDGTWYVNVDTIIAVRKAADRAKQ